MASRQTLGAGAVRNRLAQGCWSGVLALCLLSLSCQARQRGEVEGRLLGKPLENVLITFVAEEPGVPSAAGVTDAEGRFQLRGPDQSTGVAVGAYRVLLEDLEVLNAPRSEDGTVLQMPSPRFRAEYGDLQRTPLRQEVHAGKQAMDIRLADLP